MPSSILKNLVFQWNLLTGRYEAFLATSPEEVAACIQVLEEVRRKELNRVSGDSVIQSSAFAEQEVPYQLIACKDTRTDAVIGCMRLTNAQDIYPIEASRQEYQLDVFPEGMVAELSIFTRLAVLKEYRKTPAAIVIMCFAFIEALKQGGQAILMSCEPNLFKMYKRLGLRPFGQLHNSPAGGYRIPMICIPDIEHFKNIRSPALPLLRKIDWNLYRDIRNWYDQLVLEKGEIQTGATPYEFDDGDKEEHWPVTEGLKPESLKKFLNNAISVKCQEGDLLIAKEDGGKFLGIIEEGFGKVMVKDQTVAIISKGDLFGEMAYVLDQYRSADVVAGDASTQVLLFNISKLKHIATEGERLIMWRNLAKILARRLLDSHRFVVDEEE